jgi:hypothetical protein
MLGREHVAFERLRSVEPRLGDMRHSGAVIDLRRPKFANGGAHAIAIEEIDRLPRPRHDVVLRETQVLDEMAAGKPSRAGYENDLAHCRCWYCAW